MSDRARPGRAKRRPRVSQELASGENIGRYVVLEPLGVGGMSRVYAAWDPQLERKVAIKLLRTRDKPAAAERGRVRMLREAQTLAGLSHENIIEIHDVGTHRGQVYIAMELVDGDTLGRWRQRSVRKWPEVLRVMIAAGRGLAAAHQTGFVHRDFKPDNVMLGKDGRVRVMDFGLVRATDSFAPMETPLEPDEVEEPAPLELDITVAGAAVGTPQYMAPEQHALRDATPQSDQFAFCVSMYEILYGQRPYSGSTARELARQKKRGPAPPPAGSPTVPPWLRRAMTRGMSPKPDDRYPSMDALLEVLAKGRRRARRRRAAIVAGAALVGLSPVVAYPSIVEHRAIAACDDEAAAIADVWGDAPRATLDAALRGTGTPHADITAARTLQLLDAYAEDWATTSREVCLAADVSHQLDEATDERARWCLEERRLALQVQVRELNRAEATMAHEFVAAADALPAVDVCADAEFLRRQPMPPARGRAEIAALRADLLRARALADARETAEALSLARATKNRAEAIGWAPLVVEASVTAGALMAESGQLAAAEDELSQAYYAARSLDMNGVAVDAASLLVKVVGFLRERPDDALTWGRHAEAAAERLPGDPRLRLGLLEVRLAGTDETLGDREGAMARLHRALDMFIDALGEDHPYLGYILDAMARIKQQTGEYDQARALIDRSLKIRVAALGPTHPDVLDGREARAALLDTTGDYDAAIEQLQDVLRQRKQTEGRDGVEQARIVANLASMTYRRGKYDEAETYATQAAALTKRIYGPDSTHYAKALNTLAATQHAKGRYHRAREMFEEVVRIREDALGPDHPDVNDAAGNLANVLRLSGELDAAEAMLERVLASQRRTLGPEHQAIGLTLQNLANLRAGRGDLEHAEPGFREAISMLEGTVGRDHPFVAYPLAGLGGVLVRRDRPDEAIGPLERALEIRLARGASPRDLRETRFALAQALWLSGRDRERARTLAQEAIEDVPDPPDPDAKAEIQRWLAARTK